VSLLGVPVSSRGRITLRVFDPFPDFDPAVYEIEIMDKDEDLIGAAVLASEHDPSLFTQPGEPLGQGRPGSAIMHDLREVLAHPGYEGRIHVRVRPLGSRPFWPMISITDNETQHVLIVTPQ
jgi:hypothetical protein